MHSAMVMQGDPVPPTCCYAAAERKSIQVSFEYLHICSPKSGDFCRKKWQNCIINVLSKVRFTENIEIQQTQDLEGIQ